MENQEYPNRRHYGYEVESFLKIIYRFTQKTSMLVTDVEDKLHVCWWQGLVAGEVVYKGYQTIVLAMEETKNGLYHEGQFSQRTF